MPLRTVSNHGPPAAEQLEPRCYLSAVFGPVLSHTGYGPGGNFNALIPGDFDGDGVVDLAASSAHEIQFLKGRGDGTFADPVRTTLTSNIGTMAAGHFDGSTDLELAAVGNLGLALPSSSTISKEQWRGYLVRVLAFDSATDRFTVRVRMRLAYPHSEWGYTEYSALDRLYSARVLAGDVIGSHADEIIIALDLKPGRAVAEVGPQRSIIVELGLDGRELALRRTVLNRVGVGNTIALADINGDGRADLLFRPMHKWRAEISPAATTGPLSFTPQRITIPGADETALGAAFVLFADVNGDHVADRVVLGAGLRLTIALGAGDGSFGSVSVDHVIAESRFQFAAFIGLQASDLNGDGRTDILLSGGETDNGGIAQYSTKILPLLQAGDGTFSEKNYAEDESTLAPVLSDLNGDHFPNIVENGIGVYAVHLNSSP